VVLKELLKSDWESTSPELAHRVHGVIRRISNQNDSYKKVKNESNDLVLKLYPKLLDTVTKSKDSLKTAVRLAIAGNIIDFGVVLEFDLELTIRKVLKKKFAINDYTQLKESLENARSLLFFVDNAGEIGLDKLFVETLLKIKKIEKIDFVVKGGPIINDATLGDAVYMGLDRLPNSKFLFISNGEEGTGPARNSLTVKSWIREHDLVISKGQGNYEGLSEHNKIFFMLIAKCPVIASDLGVKVGDIILHYKH